MEDSGRPRHGDRPDALRRDIVRLEQPGGDAALGAPPATKLYRTAAIVLRAARFSTAIARRSSIILRAAPAVYRPRLAVSDLLRRRTRCSSVIVVPWLITLPRVVHVMTMRPLWSVKQRKAPMNDNPLPRCLLIVTAEIDAEVEADWNHWYDTVHLPDALACPGVLRGRRYAQSGKAGHSDGGTSSQTESKVYTTVYELAGPEAVTTPEFQKMRGWYQFAPHIRATTRVMTAL